MLNKRFIDSVIDNFRRCGAVGLYDILVMAKFFKGKARADVSKALDSWSISYMADGKRTGMSDRQADAREMLAALEEAFKAERLLPPFDKKGNDMNTVNVKFQESVVKQYVEADDAVRKHLIWLLTSNRRGEALSEIIGLIDDWSLLFRDENNLDICVSEADAEAILLGLETRLASELSATV